MIVPEFWAEAQFKGRVGGRPVTVRRFGWSDASVEEAQAMADARAREGFERVAAGQQLPRREPKVAYNGAEGVPIREEIVGRHGDAVVTRNAYGARCLNVPDVLFADVDFQHDVPFRRHSCLLAMVFGLGAAFASRHLTQFWPATLAAFGLGAVAGHLAVVVLRRLILALSGGAERRARSRIARFVAGRPRWLLRLYRTPAGFRVLALHRTFAPGEQETAELFDSIGTDPVYVRMCARQGCFRARLGPKPWRIGIETHMKPRPGVWPVDPDRRPERTRWIEAYERAARDYAACRFVETLGDGPADSRAEAVRRLHDELSGAESGRPIA